LNLVRRIAGAPWATREPPTYDLEVHSAEKPFWLVLGQSLSLGWKAEVSGSESADGSLGAPRLVNGYANGWLVDPGASGTFTIHLKWTPQNLVWGTFAAPHRGHRLREGALSVQAEARRLRLLLLEVFFLGTAIVVVLEVVERGRDRRANANQSASRRPARGPGAPCAVRCRACRRRRIRKGCLAPRFRCCSRGWLRRSRGPPSHWSPTGARSCPARRAGGRGGR